MKRDAFKNRISELDALRGIAACSVVLFHLGLSYGKLFPDVPHLALPVYWGSYGVQLFFAISGFVIFMTLERTERLADFAMSRFSRLYPAYWTCIIITLMTFAVLPIPAMQTDIETTAVNFTMVQELFGYRLVDPVYWTLLFELLFYILMALLWRFGMLRKPELVLYMWLSVKLLWWLIPSASPLLETILIVTHISFFAVGIAAYRIWAGARSFGQQAPLLLFGLATTWVADSTEMALVYAGVVAIMILLSLGKLRVLRHPTLIYLGAISYPLYLVHQNVGYAVMSRTSMMGLSPAGGIVLAILIALMLAHLVHNLVEIPSQTFIRDWWKSLRAQRDHPVSA